MTIQEANICPTCQFVAPTDQDDHSCIDYLRKVNTQLIADRASLSDIEPNSDSPDRVSDFLNALMYIVEEKNTEGSCYEFVARLKTKAHMTLKKWGAIT